jgi:hypothetical protein
MTRTARALATGPVAVLLVLWVTVAVAAPGEPTRHGVEPTAARPPVTVAVGSPAMLTLPVLADILEPLVLAAICGAALAFFSAGPRQTARARVPRRRWRV